MGKKKNIFCFTHYDLDGFVSYMVTKWAHPDKVVLCKPIGTFDIRDELTRWMLDNDFSNYDKVFFLDLDVSEISDLIDHDNVFIIDHHKTHVDSKKEYKHAVPIVKEYSSACLLAYKVFRKLYNTEFTDEQKTLIVYGNDYDSYTLQFEESSKLNTIFWNTQKAFENFTIIFRDGFNGFTNQQDAIYNIFKTQLEETINGLTVYKGIYADTDGECRTIIATFASQHINNVADYLLATYSPDVAIVINLKSKHVSFRRPKDGTMRLDVFAKDVADGGGHEFSAGGFITDAFMEFTKTLKPI